MAIVNKNVHMAVTMQDNIEFKQEYYLFWFFLIKKLFFRNSPDTFIIFSKNTI